ncbi:MAG TPA: TlpA disulfide reductase family protein [Pyrinomonadaceae bacterium]|jgi:thiol-disulfide isomerase/thioredoxin|nr:TlpA disulfide reductase family protein [Pyrinomonadaceae bacterium]
MKTIKGFISIIALSLALAFTAMSQTVLTTLDGGRVDLDAQRGKVVVLAIGASWLPLSAKQIEVTNALAKKYQGKDVVFYFVATDSSRPGKNFASDEQIRKFVYGNKLNADTLRDSEGGVTFHKYSVDQVPSFVVLDKQGHQVAEPFGGIDSSASSRYDITVPISRAIDKAL